MNRKKSKMNYKPYEINLRMNESKKNLDKDYKQLMTKLRKKNE